MSRPWIDSVDRSKPWKTNLPLEELHEILLRNAEFWIHIIDNKLPITNEDLLRMRDDWEAAREIFSVLDPVIISTTSEEVWKKLLEKRIPDKSITSNI
jgi:hypothetical protein